MWHKGWVCIGNGFKEPSLKNATPSDVFPEHFNGEYVSYLEVDPVNGTTENNLYTTDPTKKYYINYDIWSDTVNISHIVLLNKRLVLLQLFTQKYYPDQANQQLIYVGTPYNLLYPVTNKIYTV